MRKKKLKFPKHMLFQRFGKVKDNRATWLDYICKDKNAMYMKMCTRAGWVLRASGTRLAPTESGDEMPSRPIFYRVSNLPLRVVHSLFINYFRRDFYGQSKWKADSIF